MYKKLIALLTATLIFSMIASPTFAWYYNGSGPAADLKFEMFGPRCDRLLIKFYASAEGEWDALKANPQELDMTDWPLTKAYYDQFIAPPYDAKVNVVSVGGEFGIRCLDINNNNNPYLGIEGGDPAYPNPVAKRMNDTDPTNDFNPGSDLNFRKAILSSIDRTYYVTNIIGSGFAEELWCALPPVTGASYYDPSYMQAYPFSKTNAIAFLAAGNFKIGADGWRYWDQNNDNVKTDNETVLLKFVIRSDDTHRLNAGNHIADALEQADVKVHVNRMYMSITGARAQWMAGKDAHLYTAGWSLGAEPDSIVLWMGDAGLTNPDDAYYWHPGTCYNTGYANDAQFNVASWTVERANSVAEAIANMAICNQRMASQALEGPMFCYSSSMANARKYVGGTVDETAYVGQYWNGTTMVTGYGSDSYFGFMNMHPESVDRPQFGTIRYGFKTTDIRLFNPIYAEWVWDNDVLDLMYTGMIASNPNDVLNRMPWMCKNYEVGSYTNPSLGNCTKVTFYLREDMTFSDGTPVTMKDVYFSLVELDDILRSRGLPNPWWYSSVKSILSFSVLDPWTFEVLINVKSIWAFGLCGAGVRILPEAIWRPILTSGDPQAIAPDVNLIASGPWRLREYNSVSGFVDMVANKPGRNVTTVGAPFAGSTPKNSTYGFFNYCPILKEVKVDGQYKTKIFTAGAHTIDVNLFNDWYGGSVTVNKTVKLDGVVIGTYSGPIASRSWHNETFNLNVPWGKHTLAVVVDCTAPADFVCTGNDDSSIWVTVEQDIAGATFLGNSVPDIKVDLKDVFAAALAYGTTPGTFKWNTLADINKDYKVDLKDYFAIVKAYGFAG
jgi:ABC-type transport system substrate-binding protein